jgi:hypothetical protein
LLAIEEGSSYYKISVSEVDGDARFNSSPLKDEKLMEK